MIERSIVWIMHGVLCGGYLPLLLWFEVGGAFAGAFQHTRHHLEEDEGVDDPERDPHGCEGDGDSFIRFEAEEDGEEEDVGNEGEESLPTHEIDIRFVGLWNQLMCQCK